MVSHCARSRSTPIALSWTVSCDGNTPGQESASFFATRPTILSSFLWRSGKLFGVSKNHSTSSLRISDVVARVTLHERPLDSERKVLQTKLSSRLSSSNCEHVQGVAVHFN